MARPLRIEYAGAVYHVTVRGNQRRDIFFSKSDRERFLFKLEESIHRYDVRIYLFCLMTNHVHMVLETTRANLGRFMHRLQTAVVALVGCSGIFRKVTVVQAEGGQPQAFEMFFQL